MEVQEVVGTLKNQVGNELELEKLRENNRVLVKENAEIRNELNTLCENLSSLYKDIQGVARYELDRYEDGIDSENITKAVASLHARDVLVDVMSGISSTLQLIKYAKTYN
ncbi:MAG: hypothetical protein GY861_22550 [bacterium]|nr:hypothetical protein [bacterium]